MKTSSLPSLILLALVAFWTADGRAQYISHPTPETITPPAGTASPGTTPGMTQGMNQGMVAPSLPAEPLPVTGGPVMGPQPSYGANVQPPPAYWDPIAPPGTGAPPPTLLSQDPVFQVPAFAETQRLQRLIDEIRLDYHFLSARGSKPFGTNDLELSTTVAIPMFYNSKTPLLITPGFAFHWWQGPKGAGLSPIGVLSHLPPRVYDAYLGAEWNPQVPGSQLVSGELGFCVGVYSDFRKVTAQSLRYTGRGLLVLSLSKSFKLKGGVYYYDRVRIKMLPAAGIVWQPNPNLTFDIFFPEPKITCQLKDYGNTHWWFYCRGEYGGGSWTVVPDDKANVVVDFDQVDYNDLRCALGLEFRREDKIGGLFEVGTAFDRELVTRATSEKFSPSTTIFLRAGLIR